jgi:ubiquinone/menaquinone biosynthesis C-methylase UbiE
MSELAERYRLKYFGHQEHPYRIFERTVEQYLRPDHTLLDAGCGRTAPVLAKYRGKAKRLVGIDVVDFDARITDIELLKNDLGKIDLEDSSVDVVMARSVMEHVEDPTAVYGEMWRVLRRGGHFIFLTANLWDYASLIAKVVPNRFHPWIVARVEGREEQDVFPIQYRTNTRGAVMRYAGQAGFDVVSYDYHGQYPCYFLFNGALFLLGTAYEKLISRFEALHFLRGWILVVLKKQAAPPSA